MIFDPLERNVAPHLNKSHSLIPSNPVNQLRLNLIYKREKLQVSIHLDLVTLLKVTSYFLYPSALHQ